MNTTHTAPLNRSLSSLALLSLQLDENKDYLDYLRGFIVEAIDHLNGTPFNANSIREIIQNEFGLIIPDATILICLKRLQANQIIQRTADGQQFQGMNLPKSDFPEKRKIAQGKINNVIDKLREFAQERYQKQWDERETEAALTKFVRDYSIDFVRFEQVRSPLPELDASTASENFIIAKFIKDCELNKTRIFENIKVLVESHILAYALLCPDLENSAKVGFAGVNFVLDTRLVLKALDLETPIDTENITGLLRTIKALKGVLRIFPETIEEIRSVLRWNIQAYRSREVIGPIAEAFRKRNRPVAEIILVEGDLENRLESLDVYPIDPPSYEKHIHRFQIDEKSLQTEIEEEFGDYEHKKEKAIQHDVRVIRHIYALRHGLRNGRIEKCGHIFLTTNVALSRAAYTHQCQDGGSQWSFSPVITHFHLSHLAWLKSPMQSGDLIRTDILSSCHAAMSPPVEVWRKFLTVVDRLKEKDDIPERAHEVLRCSRSAPEELMEITQGEMDGITPENVNAILERLEKSYAIEKNEEIQTLRNELARDGEEKKQREIRIKGIAEKTARYLFCISGGLVIAATIMSFFLGDLSLWFSLPLVLLGLLSLLTGYSGKTSTRWVKKKIVKLLTNMFG